MTSMNLLDAFMRCEWYEMTLADSQRGRTANSPARPSSAPRLASSRVSFTSSWFLPTKVSAMSYQPLIPFRAACTPVPKGDRNHPWYLERLEMALADGL